MKIFFDFYKIVMNIQKYIFGVTVIKPSRLGLFNAKKCLRYIFLRDHVDDFDDDNDGIIDIEDDDDDGDGIRDREVNSIIINPTPKERKF